MPDQEGFRSKREALAVICVAERPIPEQKTHVGYDVRPPFHLKRGCRSSLLIAFLLRVRV